MTKIVLRFDFCILHFDSWLMIVNFISLQKSKAWSRKNTFNISKSLSSVMLNVEFLVMTWNVVVFYKDPMWSLILIHSISTIRWKLCLNIVYTANDIIQKQKYISKTLNFGSILYVSKLELCFFVFVFVFVSLCFGYFRSFLEYVSSRISSEYSVFRIS